MTLGNAQWQLGIMAGPGLQAELVHKPSGIVLAEGDYSYSFGTPSFARAVRTDGSPRIVRLTGEFAGGIELQHEFRVPADEPWVEEQITLTNRSLAVLALPFGRGGFVLPLSFKAAR